MLTQKQSLEKHLPFIEKMLIKVSNTEFEDKWRKLHQLITTNDSMSLEHMQKIDSTVKLLKTKLEDSFKKKRDITEEDQHMQHEANNNSMSLVPESSISVAEEKPAASINTMKRNRLSIDCSFQERFLNMKSKKAKLAKKFEKTETRTAADKQTDARPKIPILKIKFCDLFKRKHKRRQKKNKKVALRGVNTEEASTNEVAAITTKADDQVVEKFTDMFWLKKYGLQNCFVMLKPIEQIKISKFVESKPVLDALPVQSDASVEPTMDETHELISVGDIKKEVEEDAPIQDINEPPTNVQEVQKMPVTVRKFISHMMYTVNDNILVYQCKLCVFECSTKYEFQMHLTKDHRNRWFGLCQSCVENVHHVTGSLVDELEHMCKHILQEKIVIKNLPKPGPLLLNPSRKRGHATPMVSIPSSLLNQNSKPKIDKLKTFGPPTKPKPGSEILLDVNSTLKKIRPWLHSTRSTHQKYEDMCDEMLKFECLSALFKCMSIGCCFYTSDVTLFRQHIALHLRYQSSDFKNFSLCSYCSYNGDTLNELVDHILDEHGSDKYQCLYCFYRSYELQVGTHQNLYHSTKKSSVIICHVTRRKDVKEELLKVWEHFKVNVPGMSCMVCKTKFYNFARFLAHLKSHKEFPSSKCIKCGGGISLTSIVVHLRSCHGFGDYQCCFCRYGTETYDAFLVHIANHHPNKIPLFFDRSNGPLTNSTKSLPAINNTVPQLIALKQITLHLTRRSSLQDGLPANALRNEKNVQRLSKNYQIKILYK